MTMPVDMAPPYIFTDGDFNGKPAIKVCNANYVIAVIVSGTEMEQREVAKFIASSCNSQANRAAAVRDVWQAPGYRAKRAATIAARPPSRLQSLSKRQRNVYRKLLSNGLSADLAFAEAATCR